MKRLVELLRDKLHADDWRVETIHYDRDSEVSVVIFSGPYAEREATAYHRWKTRSPLTGNPVFRLVGPKGVQ